MKEQILKEIKENLKMFDTLQNNYKLNSPDAFYLLAGTVAQESNFKYTKQLGNGPARSYFQIEPKTAFDVLANYVEYRKPLYKVLTSISKISSGGTIVHYDYDELSDELLNNFNFAVFIARLCYYRRSFNFVNHDAEEYAKIWKKYYNTEQGKGTEKEFINNYKIYGIDKIDYKML